MQSGSRSILSKRRTFLKQAAVAAAVMGAGSEIYGRSLERHWLEVAKVPISIGLPAPLRVAVLGDLHYDPLCEEAYMREVVGEINALQPDLIFFTGDFITGSADCMPELSGILAEAKAPMGGFGVIGNHDCTDIGDVVSHLGSVGIHVLRNESVPLPSAPGWRLTGLVSLLMGNQATSSLDQSPPDSRHILLAHEPETFNLVKDPRIALQISGHTHGGQIRMPVVGALHLPKWGKNYEMGLYRDGERQLYVNRGIGTIGINVRFNCRPELTLLELS